PQAGGQRQNAAVAPGLLEAAGVGPIIICQGHGLRTPTQLELGQGRLLWRRAAQIDDYARDRGPAQPLPEENVRGPELPDEPQVGCAEGVPARPRTLE